MEALFVTQRFLPGALCKTNDVPLVPVQSNPGSFFFYQQQQQKETKVKAGEFHWWRILSVFILHSIRSQQACLSRY